MLALAITRVALADVLDHLLQVPSLLQPAATATRFRTGIQEDFHLRVGENHGADITALHHNVTGPGHLSLQVHHHPAHSRHCGNHRGSRRHWRRANGIGNILSAGQQAFTLGARYKAQIQGIGQLLQPFGGVELTPAQATTSTGSIIGTLLPDGNYGVIPFANDSYFITAGNSAYNSAQVNWRHTSARSQVLLGYTFSKAIDNASGYGEQINPYNPRLSRGLSAFDSTHNFVISYSYTLPFDKLGGPKRLTNGWAVSGITRFATGLPVTLVETDDRSLQGTAFGGPIILSADTPNLIGPVNISDPRKTGGQYFSPAAFGPSALGQEGNSGRRFFHGPGVNDWNFAVLKDTAISERVNLQFRAELFNIFNHTQFIGPSGITGFSGNVSNTASFGQVNQAAPPRIGQLALKLNF